MKNIDIDELLLFHNKIVDKTGGSKGIRDKTLLISALNRANMTFGGEDLYYPLERKIAVTAYSLISNHGFIV